MGFPIRHTFDLGWTTVTSVSNAPTTPSAQPTRAADPVVAAASAPRFSGLDGLRAIAVTLVIVYHLLPGTLVGGYIGVDVFFVISGFLITSLLLRERATNGRIRLGAFWLRRARRLLPALAIVVLACCSAAFVVGGDTLVDLGEQVIGASTFSYNWVAIIDGSSYFDETAPELFRNLWSLAVEEQFYLLWPIVIAVLARPALRRASGWIVGSLALASAAAMTVLFTMGADSTRVYYGTDTHSFGLALGALLAITTISLTRESWTERARTLATVTGLVALAALVAIAALMSTDAALVYRGGLAAVSALTAIVILATLVPGSPLGRVLDVAPLRWIGERSYGLYLWHWPVFVLAAAALPWLSGSVAGPLVLAAIALAITVVAAALSYRFVEQPIRRDGFQASLARFGGAWRGGRRHVAGVVVASVGIAAVVSLTVSALVVAPRDSVAQAQIEAGQDAVDRESASEPAAVALPGGDQITAVGDSVMLASAPTLKKDFPGIEIDAVVSRQMKDLPDLIRAMQARGELRATLLVGLGTNGPIDAKTLEDALTLVGPRTQVVLVNVQAPRDWTTGVNRTLTEVARGHRNVELANWRDAIRPRLDVLSPDQIHPGGPIGGGIYTGAVRDALQRLAELPPLLNSNDYGLSPRPV